MPSSTAWYEAQRHLIYSVRFHQTASTFTLVSLHIHTSVSKSILVPVFQLSPHLWLYLISPQSGHAAAAWPPLLCDGYHGACYIALPLLHLPKESAQQPSSVIPVHVWDLRPIMVGVCLSDFSLDGTKSHLVLLRYLKVRGSISSKRCLNTGTEKDELDRLLSPIAWPRFVEFARLPIVFISCVRWS